MIGSALIVVEGAELGAQGDVEIPWKLYPFDVEAGLRATTNEFRDSSAYGSGERPPLKLAGREHDCTRGRFCPQAIHGVVRKSTSPMIVARFERVMYLPSMVVIA